MSKDAMANIIEHIVSDQQFHSKLVELYFLATDREVGELTWQIAGLPQEKRHLLTDLVRLISDSGNPKPSQ
jgi:hypothetical protein